MLCLRAVRLGAPRTAGHGDYMLSVVFNIVLIIVIVFVIVIVIVDSILISINPPARAIDDRPESWSRWKSELAAVPPCRPSLHLTQSGSALRSWTAASWRHCPLDSANGVGAAGWIS